MKINPVSRFSNGIRLNAILVMTLLVACAMGLSAQNSCEANFTYALNQTTKTATFTNTSFGTNVHYYWNFGDNTGSTLANPVKTFGSGGTYTVCLTVMKNDSTRQHTRCSTLVVTIPCNAAWTVITDPTNKLKKYFTANNTSLDYNYYWTFGDATFSNDRTPNHTYLHDGKFKVCLRVTKKDSSCSHEMCDSITVSPNSIPGCVSTWTLTTDPSNNLKKYFSSTSTSNDFNYYWTFGDGISADSKTPIHIYPHAGRYKVCLRVSKKDSSCTSTTCDSITVSASNTSSCEANFTYTKTGREVHFTNTSSGTYTRIVWHFGDNTISDQTNPVHNYAQNGTYTVCQHIYRIVGNDTLCTSHRCSTIVATISSYTCIASFTYSVNQVLRRVEFHNTSTGQFLTYRWTFGDDSISTDLTPAPHTYIHNGNYRVCLRIINSLDTNCRSEYCTFIYIHTPGSIPDPSNAIASYSFSIPNPAMNTVQFSSSSTGAGLSLAWDFGDGEFSNDENPIHSFVEKNWYLVCLQAIGINNTDIICQNVYPDPAAPTGIEKPENLQISKIYPNPFNEQVKVELISKMKTTVLISISDISGKIIEEKQLSLLPGKNEYQFETYSLVNGFYLLNISGEGIQKRFKLIK